MKKKLKDHWLFLCILFVAATVRFYRLPEMAAYDHDQEYVSNFVYDVVYEYPIRFVGQGMSIQGLFMGPWYFYYLVPFYGLTGWQPLGGLIGSVILGLVIITLYYLIGTKLFSKPVGLLSALLRSCTFFAINVDWMMVPAHQSDLLVLVFWYGLYLLWKKHRLALPLLAVTCGLFTSFHPVQLPLWIVLGVLLIAWRVKLNWRIWLISLGLFIAPSVPLIMFEYWRKGAMIKTVLALLSSDTGPGFNPSQIWVKTNMLIDFFEELIALPSAWFWPGLGLFLGFICVLAWMIKKKKLPAPAFHHQALMTTFITVIVYYALFPGNVSEYYLGSLRALLYLYVPLVLIYLSHLSRHAKLAVIALVAYILFHNLQIMLNRYQHPEELSTYYHKQRIIDHILSKIGDQDFALSLITEPGWNWGFNSLLRLKHHPSAGKGPVYSIIAPRTMFSDPEYDFVSGNLGLTYPDTEDTADK